MDWRHLPLLALENRVLSSSEHGCVSELYRPAPTVLVSRISGRFTAAAARELAAASTLAATDDDEIYYFGDWELMESYETDARRTMMNWGRAHHGRLKSGTYVLGSRIVEMGVNVAGAAMAILGIEIRATSREAHNAALLERIRAASP